MKDLLSFLPGFVTAKVDRANNLVAHELAKLGRSVNEPVFSTSAPPCVVGLINRDCNSVCGSI
jgi:hypothetical protein